MYLSRAATTSTSTPERGASQSFFKCNKSNSGSRNNLNLKMYRFPTNHLQIWLYRYTQRVNAREKQHDCYIYTCCKKKVY